MIAFDPMLYRATAAPAVVDVPERPYLMVEGHGDPDGDVYKRAVEGLYAVAYAIRFARKAQGHVYSVMPLEGLWYAEDRSVFAGGDRARWQWTMMIRQPDEATADVVAAALDTARAKGRNVEGVGLRTLHEGTSGQILHVGPYATEPETIGRLLAHLHANGYALAGEHHEIYLSDPRRSAPEKLRTIIRYPVTRP
ncbi:MAG: hypothetical protein HOV79_22150 [Hamadaea sp.]|nr:hypothetical protein [Hamadaea sp.]